MNRFSMHFVAVVLASYSCNLALAQQGNAALLQRAVHCLSVKQFLPSSRAKDATFDYFLEEKEYPGEKILYVVEFSNSSRRDGLVFSVFLTEHDGLRNFNIQNNASFKLSRNGGHDVQFTEPPLGGTWTQEHLISAIKQIVKQPKAAIAAKSLATNRFFG